MTAFNTQVDGVLAIYKEERERDHGTKRTRLNALAQLCRQLGGRLTFVSRRTLSDIFNQAWPDDDDDEFDLEHHDGYSPAVDDDADHGLNWREKIIYAVRGSERLGSIIHEMGHVFADRHPPDSSKCNEWRWFGWEMAVAIQIGAWASWSLHNENYWVGGGGTWSELENARRRAVIADRIKYARKIGLVDDSGPKSIR